MKTNVKNKINLTGDLTKSNWNGQASLPGEELTYGKFI